MSKKNLLLFVLIFSLLFSVSGETEKKNDSEHVVYFFYSTTCPHCINEKAFLEDLGKKYSQLDIRYIEISENENYELLKIFSEKYGTTTVGVPRTFIREKVFIGFDKEDGELIYHQGYKAYIGYKNQIEKAILECLNITCPIGEQNAIEISKKDTLVKELLEKDRNSIATYYCFYDYCLVAWWSTERIKSNLQYPNVIVKIDPFAGKILDSKIPTEEISGIEKPIQEIQEYYILILVAVLVYLFAYLVLKNKTKVLQRYWLVGFFTLLIISGFIIAITTPSKFVENFAKKFPFPIFVFIIALVDGLNPCAFTVLIVLLSLLTYTRSRKSMFLVGTIFILTSGFMYFIFIAILLSAGSLFFTNYGIIILKFIGGIMFIVGIINLKDFFWFKKGGISLTISDKHKEKIYKKSGKIVHELKEAKTSQAFILALFGVILLAIFVNLVELGCTAMLPMAYIAALLKNFGSELSLQHYFYTAFYSFVYIIPLFTILGNFLYSFKSKRLSEKQGRILKLIGGLLMLALGLILLIKPELLVFG